MKTVNQLTRAMVLLMLFSTAFVLARPVLAEEVELADEIRAEAKLAAKQLLRAAEIELKDKVDVPEVAEKVSVAQAEVREQPTS